MYYLLSYSFQVWGAWDWFGAIYVKLHHGTVDHGDGGCYRLCIGYYKIARETGSKFVPQTVPVSCETTKFEVARETGSVLCQIASWDCFGDAIASFIGWVKICPPNSPTVQFGTALSKSPPRLYYWTVLGYLFFHCLYDAKLSTKMGQNSSGGRGDKECYGRCVNGEWKAMGTKVEDV